MVCCAVYPHCVRRGEILSHAHKFLSRICISLIMRVKASSRRDLECSRGQNPSFGRQHYLLSTNECYPANDLVIAADGCTDLNVES